MEYNFYSYEDLNNGINKIARQIILDNWKPHFIVGILRGGIVPAVHLSHWFECPLLSLAVSTRDRQVIMNNDFKNIFDIIKKEKNILLVDDICDTGLTLDKILSTITLRKNKIKVACLHYNIGQDLFDPDYFHLEINKNEDSRWIVYPWEKI